MTTFLAEVNVERLTSVVTSGFLICLCLLVVALYRNLKLKAENNRLRSSGSDS
ncbi:hypothetical protein [Robertkochia marina]|uniref:hypothetical protein n=1 Tax=Robertkochia marina TaxID=1227945 RepID=UPI001454CFA7|nr:hypothetical protein [Robertkochia marina]